MNKNELLDKFVENITKLLTQFNYSPAIFTLKLNSFINKDEYSISQVYSWIKKENIPTMYDTYVISNFFKFTMDQLINPCLDINTAFGRSFAPQPSEIQLPPMNELSLLVETETQCSKENTTMATKNNNRIINVSRKSKKSMEEVVYARTTSRNTNLLLANKIYSSGVELKTIAEFAGKSTRSMRDYAFYGMSVPSDTASKLVKYFKTSYHNLGLVYNADTDRYEHMTIKATK